MHEAHTQPPLAAGRIKIRINAGEIYPCMGGSTHSTIDSPVPCCLSRNIKSPQSKPAANQTIVSCKAGKPCTSASKVSPATTGPTPAGVPV